MDPQYALVAYIRNPVGEFVERLRRELHPEHAHILGHVTVLPPRPLLGKEACAVEHVTRACRDVKPFEISVGSVETFLPTTPTVFLQISYAAYKLRELHDVVNANELAYKEPLPYMPHITIAKLSTVERAREVLAEARERWDHYEGPRRILIDTLTFVRGREHTWEDLAAIKLGRSVAESLG